MGIFDFLLRIFGKKAQPEALAINQSQINQSLNQSISETPKELTLPGQLSQPTEPTPLVELQRESVQLGLAAGYTGRALKEIEASLVRIESQLLTKDWLLAQFGDQSRIVQLLTLIKDTLKTHDELTMKRFESLESAIYSLQGIAQRAPEPVRTEMLKEIRTIEAQLPPSPKMLELIDIVKRSGEISYTDLAANLGITESALRGLLTLTIRRTGAVQRFERAGRGWVRVFTT
jgi:hypothetical protein